MSNTMPLCQIALSTMDLMRTSHWYRTTFGWQASGERREREGDIWAQVPGLPEASFMVWWLIDQPRFFQLELFEFRRPRMRPQRQDARPSDLGYASIGVHVPDLDPVLDRITCTGGVLLTGPHGVAGKRRVCLRDPEGVLLELMEGAAPIGAGAADAGVLGMASSIRISVPNLDRALRFWADALGLDEEREIKLHEHEHESLWGLTNVKPATQLLRAGEFLVELVEYPRSVRRQREAGYLLSDQGILNVALGTTDKAVFDAVFERTQSAGYRACYPPWTLPGVATVVYVQDGQGLTVELLCIEPNALERMGFPRNEVASVLGGGAASAQDLSRTLIQLVNGENGVNAALALSLALS
jgi:catechol 2,3-dioxygenase-like lactoylglutathione lyase family enzyme